MVWKMLRMVEGCVCMYLNQMKWSANRAPRVKRNLRLNTSTLGKSINSHPYTAWQATPPASTVTGKDSMSRRPCRVTTAAMDQVMTRLVAEAYSSASSAA